MGFVEELLKEQEQLLTEELRFAEDEEYIETGNRLTDVKNALIKLGLCDVGSSSDLIVVELSDNEIKLITEKELKQWKADALEFDGFEGWLVRGRLVK